MYLNLVCEGSQRKIQGSYLQLKLTGSKLRRSQNFVARESQLTTVLRLVVLERRVVSLPIHSSGYPCTCLDKERGIVRTPCIILFLESSPHLTKKRRLQRKT